MNQEVGRNKNSLFIIPNSQFLIPKLVGWLKWLNALTYPALKNLEAWQSGLMHRSCHPTGDRP